MKEKRKISLVVSSISPSATCSIAEKAEKLKKSGVDVIEFAEGEPDFDTPVNIKEAAEKAIKEGFTKYTAVSGIQELKEAICTKFKRENNIQYEPSQILVSSGAKHSLFTIFMTLLEKGDEVLIPTPAYVSYIEQIKLAGAVPVYFPTKEEDNFRVTLELIKANYNPKVKAFVLNSPNNPSGAVYKEEDLREIAEFLVEKGVWIITDEVYEHLVYDGAKHVSMAAIDEKVKDNTITINGLSKTYAMTGWRVGYAAGPKYVIDAAGTLQGHVTGNINSIAQKAAIEALLGSQDEVKKMVEKYTKRRKLMVEKLNSIKGISCNKPDGAFYAFPDISGLYGARNGNKVIKNEMDVVNFFLDEAYVAIVPGSAFEYPDHVRFVFAKSLETIEEGLNRIEKAVSKLQF